MNSNFNLKSIAFFCATGFFPDKDTYLKNEEYSYPETSFRNSFDSFSNFKWYYQPENSNLSRATENFANIFESIIDREFSNDHVILPLSGGLDSRTLAAALKRTGKKVTSYSYSFKNGHDESKYGNLIANEYAFPFHSLQVEQSYLWGVIEDLARTNRCYSEFTHPRQMAFSHLYASYGDKFALGHWGDVLFDDMRVNDKLSFSEIKKILQKKICKSKGIDLASDLWKIWGLENTFQQYFDNRLEEMLQSVYIESSANATVRAFKSKYWATRWTASNFCIFEKSKPISVPYFSIEMCDFICRLPENLLSGRQIQIEYLKKYAPELAKISWQAHKPFNLYNYQLNRTPINLPYRIINKLAREYHKITGLTPIQRNWELQFLGEKNRQCIEKYLFDNKEFDSFIPQEFTNQIYSRFYKSDSLGYAHSISTLLTIALRLKIFND